MHCLCLCVANISAGYLFLDRSPELFHEVLDWLSGDNTETEIGAELKKELELYGIQVKQEEPTRTSEEVDSRDKAEEKEGLSEKHLEVVRYIEMGKEKIRRIESEMER